MPLNAKQISSFERDGFLILERFFDTDFASKTANRIAPLFRGEFPTGMYPDEWNWREGIDTDNLTRQICNGWKSDPVIASIVLSEAVGQACAQLAGWSGARMGQDNVLWKPPGAKALGFHQDDSYCQWVNPPNFITCWMPLDPTSADGGTLEYVAGSHRWGLFPKIRQFHAPEDYHEALNEAAETVGKTPQIVPVEVPAGGCAFHAGATWHGSGANSTKIPRRALVSHCLSEKSQFDPTEISYIYNRYKRQNSLAMDEDFFPILWGENNSRTSWLDKSFTAKPNFSI